MVEIARAPLAWARLSAAAGGVVWLLLLPVSLPYGTTDGGILRAIQLAMLVCVPLGLALLASPAPPGRFDYLYHLAVWLQPVAGLLAAFSCLRTPGRGTAALAVGWFIDTAILALYSLTWLRARRTAPNLCLCVGMLLLPVGSGFFLAYQLGLHPGGYGVTLTLLIVLHYHYAGFAAPLLTGFAGNRLATVPLPGPLWGLYRAVAVGACAGSPLIAIGASSAPVVEVVAVCILAASLAGLSALVLGWLVPRTERQLPRALLAISSCAVFFSMLVAILYAVSNGIGHSLLSVAAMTRIHGTANAAGFVLCGLLAWNLSPDAPHLAA